MRSLRSKGKKDRLTVDYLHVKQRCYKIGINEHLDELHAS
jgi:hypothetical protein